MTPRSEDGLTPSQLLRVAAEMDLEATHHFHDMRMVKRIYDRSDEIREEAIALNRAGWPRRGEE